VGSITQIKGIILKFVCAMQ